MRLSPRLRPPPPPSPRMRGDSTLSRASSPPLLHRCLHTVFYGTDDFSLPSLRALHESLAGRGPHAGLVTGLDVVCPSPRPAGRGQQLQDVPVGAFARAAGLRTLHVPYGLRSLRGWDALGALRAGSPLPPPHAHDVGVVVSFGYFMPPHLLDALRLGAVNVHPSLLPAYRGAAPIEHALLNGDARTGVSIIELHRTRFDAGAVLDQVAAPIEPADTCGTLTPRLAAVGAQRLMHVLAHWAPCHAGAVPQPEPGAGGSGSGGGDNSNSSARRAPKLASADGLIRWDDAAASSCEGLLRRHRAFDASFGVYSHLALPPRREGAGAAGAASAAAATGSGAASGAASGGGGGHPARPLQRVRLLALERPSPQLAGELAALPEYAAAAPGALAYERRAGDALLLRASDGWLCVARLHVETRRPVSGREAAHGYKIGGPATGHALRLQPQPPAAGAQAH